MTQNNLIAQISGNWRRDLYVIWKITAVCMLHPFFSLSLSLAWWFVRWTAKAHWILTTFDSVRQYVSCFNIAIIVNGVALKTHFIVRTNSTRSTHMHSYGEGVKENEIEYIVRDANACSFFAYDIRITMCDLMISDKICERMGGKRDGAILRKWDMFFSYIFHRVESLSVHQNSIFVSHFNCWQAQNLFFYWDKIFGCRLDVSKQSRSDNVTFLCSSKYARMPNDYYDMLLT